jgi:alanine-synthesizing transaminase
MVSMNTVRQSEKLRDVCYDIRGPVHKEARRLEDEGHRIIKLNIGNPAPFGFDAPEEIIKDVILNMPQSQGYCDSKGLFSARKAVMQYYQQKGMRKVDIDDIYIGNGASELIVMAMQALLNNGDEMLVPGPRLPAVDRRRHPLRWPCRCITCCDEGADWHPDLDDIRARRSPRVPAAWC